MKPRITVIGSINVDLITKVSRWPKPGETITSNDFMQLPGGKGANQAVAASRLGAEVTMLGCVGDDSLSQWTIENLKNEGVLTNYVEPVSGFHTGRAFITLAEKDNQIIVVPGANLACTSEWIKKYEKVIAESDMVLLQMEIPLSTVKQAAQIAQHHNVKVILNPAPFQLIDKEFLKLIDLITPNEHEYRQLQPLLSDFEGDLIVTCGEKGVMFLKEGEEVQKHGHKVQVVDTTGAGDTFNGALALKWAESGSLDRAIDFAIVASAISVTKIGAQSGMPTQTDIESFLEERRLIS